MEEELKSLKEKLSIQDNHIFKNNAYYEKNTNEGPYCSRCFDKDKRLIRIISKRISSNYATCPECKNQVNYTGIENSPILPTTKLPNKNNW